MPNDALIIDAVRSPRGKGKKNGALHPINPQRVLAQVLNALRDRKREVPLESALLDKCATDTCDPELSCLRDRFGTAVDRALERAMRLLTPDERLLLRQRFLDGLTPEQLAGFHRKHRITMVRRLNGILRTLRARTEVLLANDVGCGHSTAVSLVNLALSQAHLSIRRYLAPHD